MDYSTFKSLQILLFWGSAIGFCIWQLRSVQRLRKQRVEVRDTRQSPSGASEITRKGR